MVRDDECIRLTTVHLRTSIENGWCTGALTSTYGVTKHVHRYSRLGNAETGYIILDYDTIYHGHQCYGIPFETVSSGIASRLLWRCPVQACGRLAAVLYRPHGGAYFLCRHCWRITYASQCESRLSRALRLIWQVRDRTWTARASRQWERDQERLLASAAVLETETDRSKHRRERWNRTPRRRGRPSPKRERAEQRKAARAVRDARPRRPPGRPREKHVYTTRAPIAHTEARGDVMQGFCPRCRDRRELVEGTPVTFRNGRNAIQGRCACCSTRMARIVPGTVGEAAAQSQAAQRDE